MKLAVLNIDGKEKESLDLPENIFGVRVNTDLLHQAVVMYLASQRQGNVSTKERNEISGGGIKPFRQKGTGRARAGSIRSPLWHGGGVVFGPKPRDFSYSLPKKIKKAALRESLNAKYQDKNLICLADVTSPMQKTKEFVKVLSTLGIKGKVLACFEGCDPTVERVSRNIRIVNIVRASDVNAHDILRSKHFLVTKTAFSKLLERVVDKKALGETGTMTKKAPKKTKTTAKKSTKAKK